MTAITIYIYLSGYMLALALIWQLNVRYYAEDSKISLPRGLILSLPSYVAIAAIALVFLEIVIKEHKSFKKLNKLFTGNCSSEGDE